MISEKKEKTDKIIIDNIRLDIDCNDSDAIKEAVRRLDKVPESRGRIYKKSIDARHKNNIKFVYSVIFEENKEENNFSGIILNNEKKIKENPPVIAGFGPAGMFCALALSENGYNPIVFEMGSDIDERVKKVDNLFKNSVLDEKTNVCYGEG